MTRRSNIWTPELKNQFREFLIQKSEVLLLYFRRVIETPETKPRIPSGFFNEMAKSLRVRRCIVRSYFQKRWMYIFVNCLEQSLRDFRIFNYNKKNFKLKNKKRRPNTKTLKKKIKKIIGGQKLIQCVREKRDLSKLRTRSVSPQDQISKNGLNLFHSWSPKRVARSGIKIDLQDVERDTVVKKTPITKDVPAKSKGFGVELTPFTAINKQQNQMRSPNISMSNQSSLNPNTKSSKSPSLNALLIPGKSVSNSLLQKHWRGSSFDRSKCGTIDGNIRLASLGSSFEIASSVVPQISSRRLTTFRLQKAQKEIFQTQRKQLGEISEPMNDPPVSTKSKKQEAVVTELAVKNMTLMQTFKCSCGRITDKDIYEQNREIYREYFRYLTITPEMIRVFESLQLCDDCFCPILEPHYLKRTVQEIYPEFSFSSFTSNSEAEEDFLSVKQNFGSNHSKNNSLLHHKNHLNRNPKASKKLRENHSICKKEKFFEDKQFDSEEDLWIPNSESKNSHHNKNSSIFVHQSPEFKMESLDQISVNFPSELERQQISLQSQEKPDFKQKKTRDISEKIEISNSKYTFQRLDLNQDEIEKIFGSDLESKQKLSDDDNDDVYVEFDEEISPEKNILNIKDKNPEGYQSLGSNKKSENLIPTKTDHKSSPKNNIKNLGEETDKDNCKIICNTEKTERRNRFKTNESEELKNMLFRPVKK